MQLSPVLEKVPLKHAVHEVDPDVTATVPGTKNMLKTRDVLHTILNITCLKDIPALHMPEQVAV